ncbi:MAG: HAD-IA family hydrolase [Pseudomonadota bacterium]
MRLVIFDMDGTIVDSQHVIVSAMSAGFAAAGLAPPSHATILGIVGLSLHEAVAALAPGEDAAGHARIAAGYREAMAAARGKTDGAEATARLYPGARDVLVSLAGRPDHLLGIATGKARRGLEHTLEAHGLGSFFVTTQTSDNHPSKPHPAMVEAALRETGLPAAAAVMIGDTEFDIAMGRAAGVATLGVTWGYHPADRLRAAGADLLIDDFAELEAALDRLRPAA